MHVKCGCVCMCVYIHLYQKYLQVCVFSQMYYLHICSYRYTISNSSALDFSWREKLVGWLRNLPAEH